MQHRHLIGKQVFDVKIVSSKNAYEIQQKLSEFFWNTLLPEMTELFDREVADEEVFHIDQLELDLGRINLIHEESGALVQKIISLLEAKLQELHVLRIHADPTPRGMPPVSSGKPLRNHYFDLWLYWLENGLFPSYSLHPPDHWIDYILETLGIEDRAVVRLQELLKRSPVSHQRLVLQHEAKDLKSVVELYTGHGQKLLLSMLSELQNLVGKRPSVLKISAFRELEIIIWNWVFKWVIHQRQKLDVEALSIKIISSILDDYVILSEVKAGINKVQFPQLSKLFSQEILKKTTALQSDLTELEVKETFGDTELEDLGFVKNAGVILLHPFIARLFSALDLLEEKTFKDVQSMSRGVLLIHYLATGKKKAPEYDMTLPKFLCQMGPHLPLDFHLQLNDEECSAADTLLQAAIDHWAVLGKTSPDGLREVFLQRDGKLIKEGHSWKLSVEQKAQDILLDKLPWNLSLIKLPWMKEILKVEWR